MLPTVLYTGKLALSSAHVDEVSYPRKEPNISTRRTMTPSPFPVTSWKKGLNHGARHGAYEGNECIVKQKRCCKKLANRSMEDINPFLRDGTKMTITESICIKNGWTEEQIIQYDKLPWKTTPTLQNQKERARNEQKIVYSRWIKNVIKDQSINDLFSLKQNFFLIVKKNCMMNMWKRLHQETHPFILDNDQDNEDTNNLKGLKNIIIKSMPKQDGRLTFRNHRETCRGIQHIRPLQISGENWTSWRSSPWTEQFFQSFFRLLESEFPGNRRRV